MKAAYFEFIGGASGNMLLGSLVDCGLNLADIEDPLRTIETTESWHFSLKRTSRRGISSALVDVIVRDDSTQSNPLKHRTLGEILDSLEASRLSIRQKERVKAIYTRLALAESKVHGLPLEQVFFHEVGETDAVIDIASFVLAIDLLGVESIYCSPFPLGRGWIDMKHGKYPNPPPATAELLLGYQTFDARVVGETVTTTAAAIMSTLADRSCTRPTMKAEAIGYGAGHYDFDIPNVTRATIGTMQEAMGTHEGDMHVLETNIDDMNPQDYEEVLSQLHDAGAADVWIASILMKKNRPGVMLSALVAPTSTNACVSILLKHTTTIGVRFYPVKRVMLPRETVLIQTPVGAVEAKRVWLDSCVRIVPEYDDVIRISKKMNWPIWLTRQVIATATQHER